MPRPRPGYTRPSETPCTLCGGPVPVGVAGRIPDAHPACGELQRAQTRVLAALVASVAGRSPSELRRLRGAWGDLQSSGNTVWNRVDNPARRGKD